MDVFSGRPDLLLLFVAQIAFIIVQILIYLRVSRDEKRSTNAREMKTEKTSAAKNKSKSTATAKRKLSRR